MTNAQSAGILLYRWTAGTLEVFLVHPGGPFWKGRNAGTWTIPKGEIEDGEPALDAAVREFHEETGIALEETTPPREGSALPREGTAAPREGAAPPPEGTAVPREASVLPSEASVPPSEDSVAPRQRSGVAHQARYQPLSPVRQKGGKRIFAWALSGNLDPALIVSNTFELEWPRHSGRQQTFPEVDKGGWFTLPAARDIINPAQIALLEELEETVPHPPQHPPPPHAKK